MRLVALLLLGTLPVAAETRTNCRPDGYGGMHCTTREDQSKTATGVLLDHLRAKRQQPQIIIVQPQQIPQQPATQLVLPSFCPVGGEQFNNDYLFCPKHGVELRMKE